MLQWTNSGKGLRLMLLIHHIDAERKWAYGRESKVGHLDKALDEAKARGWTIVGMEKDCKVMYLFERKGR